MPRVIKDNHELVEDAVRANKLGYSSYGKMKAQEYASSDSTVKKRAEKARASGYITMRERMQQKEANQ